MNSIQVLDKEFVPYLSEKEIQEKITELAHQLNKDYAGKRPIFLSILNGSFLGASLVLNKRRVVPATSVLSVTPVLYIIILEDIIDTGKTLHHYLPQLLSSSPASVKIAVLLNKKEALQFPVQVDYTCFEIPNKFVVGYGLDYDGLGRNSKDIYQLK